MFRRSGMTVKVLPVLLAIAIITTQDADAQIAVPEITLEQLIVEADAIFVGQVIATDVYRQIDGLPARISELRVVEPFKGVKNGEVVAVKQFQPASIPVEVGETVLWYIKGDVHREVFSQPIHRWGADFRSPEFPVLSRLLMMNQLRNRNLWSQTSNTKLWNNSTFPRDVAAQYLRELLSVHDPTLKKNGWLDTYVEELLSPGDKPNVEGWLRLEFLMAATYARLSQR